MTTDRPNTALAAVIDQVLAEQTDARAAAALLLEHGATFALICRVLAEPERRRAVETTLAPAALGRPAQIG
jgi:hypothetical protein